MWAAMAMTMTMTMTMGGQEMARERAKSQDSKPKGE